MFYLYWMDQESRVYELMRWHYEPLKVWAFKNAPLTEKKENTELFNKFTNYKLRIIEKKQPQIEVPVFQDEPYWQWSLENGYKYTLSQLRPLDLSITYDHRPYVKTWDPKHNTILNSIMTCCWEDVFLWEEEEKTEAYRNSWDYYQDQTSFAFDLITFLQKDLKSDLVMIDSIGVDIKHEILHASIYDYFSGQAYTEFVGRYCDEYIEYLIQTFPLFFNSQIIADRFKEIEDNFHEPEEKYGLLNILKNTFLGQTEAIPNLVEQIKLYALASSYGAPWIIAINLNSTFGETILNMIQKNIPPWFYPTENKQFSDSMFYPYSIFRLDSSLYFWQQIPLVTERLSDFILKKDLFSKLKLPHAWTPKSQIGYDYSRLVEVKSK